MSKKLRRSDNKMIAGVCAGMAEYLGIEISLFRIFYLVFSVVSAAFPGTLVYIICWMIIPKK